MADMPARRNKKKPKPQLTRNLTRVANDFYDAFGDPGALSEKARRLVAKSNDLLARGANPKAVRTEYEGKTLLHLAAEINSPKFAQRLLAAGIGVDETDYTGQSPLMLAARSSGSLTRLFLDRGADPDIKDALGETAAFHAAAYGGGDEIFSLLIGKGANIELRNHRDRTPLLCAIENKNIQGSLALIKAGAAVNVALNDGNTALHMAARTGLETVFLALLERGAVLDARNKYDQTPLEAAQKAYQAGTAKFLEDAPRMLAQQRAERAEKTHRDRLSSLERILKRKKGGAQ